MVIKAGAIAAAIAGVVYYCSAMRHQDEVRGEEVARVDAASNPTADQRAIAEANSLFAFDLYQRLAAADSGNLFFSPASISAGLAMTHAGADGQTAKEMADVLHFTLPGDRLHAAFAAFLAGLGDGGNGAYELRIANRLWGHEGYRFLPPFLDVTRRHYGAELAQVDFAHETEAARREINDWVARETQEKIQDLIPPGVLDSLTRLVLTNAIYFKGQWSAPFSERATQDAPFTLPGGRQVDVPLMAQHATFRYASLEELQVLELPYAGGNLSMLVLLPTRVDGLADLERRLTAENLSQWSAALARHSVHVLLPRFRLDSEFNLSDTLAAMGMPTAFDQTAADFSRMSDEDDLYIQAVLHKAFVDVNEEGTEAAAATGVAVGVRSAPGRAETFRADHPFAFMIRDNATGGILFLGRVTNPNE